MGAAEVSEKPVVTHEVMDKGLKRNAVGFASNVVIGVASTGPAYSLATTLGFVIAVVGVGLHGPAIALIAFIPMLLVASAYKFFNRADPDAGTTFAWVTRAFGPGTGWLNGWAIFLADLLVMASLSDVAAVYTLKLFGIEEHQWLIILLAVGWIVLMTWICYRGIELSAKLQMGLLGIEVVILAIFSIVAFIKVYGSHPPSGSIKPTLDWINPFTMSFGTIAPAVLVAFFIYWGWDSGVAVNEESRDPAEGPGKSAIVSTILLVLIYVVTVTAAQSFHGPGFLTNEENQADILNALGHAVLGEPWNKLLVITVLTSASASTQTTILPTARTTLSMANWKAVSPKFARVHEKYMTPTWSTIGFGGLSVIVTIAMLLLSESVLEASITAVGFPVVFYYGFTGVACAFFFRRELRKSARNFFMLGLFPILGGLAMWAVGVYSITYYSKEEHGGKLYAGVTLPLWMGIGGLVVGAIIMFASRHRFKEYFSRKTEVGTPEMVEPKHNAQVLAPVAER